MFDYLIRVVEGKYVLEEVSGLTGLTHFAFTLRIFYLYLIFVDCFSIKSFQTHFATVFRTFNSSGKNILILLILASFTGVISYSISEPSDNN